MDDYSITSLQESRNEWCARLINILTPLVIEGFRSIFDESWKLCDENDELEKYLMTFQNFLARVPKWNPNIVTEETNRIVEKSNCGYLTDLISCVHIIQLKSLTCMRVGNQQKKIDISVPSLENFIHKVYINIPVEDILKVYLDETVEDDVQVEETEEIISTEPVEEKEVESQNVDDVTVDSSNVIDETPLEIAPLENESEYDKKDSIKFDDVDRAVDLDNKIEEIIAPKTEERLEQISNERNEARKLEEMEDDDDDDKITIGEKIKLTELDVHDLEKPKELNKVPLGLEEIEILT
jgi:hypothetical protein